MARRDSKNLSAPALHRLIGYAEVRGSASETAIVAFPEIRSSRFFEPSDVLIKKGSIGSNPKSRFHFFTYDALDAVMGLPLAR
ncbi:hypothetical protein DC522_32695 [Microvirga sp. KLBC 81]|nr:hypothetical protein DC522_32695 [Microvirga sp. KLBC 81]